MCLVALFFRVAADAPVVVGANREEFYARGGEPPQLLDGPVPAAGGRDPSAGGTWLGVNARGLLVAVTNRRKTDLPAQPLSRGLLVRRLLGLESAALAADEATRELDTGRYAGCNVLCADASRAVVIHAADWLRVRPLPAGLHVLSNGDVNDASDRRVNAALERLGAGTYPSSVDCVRALTRLCGNAGGPVPICFRDVERGTVSSSVLALRHPLSDGTYLHAQGPPDRTPYEDYSHLLRRLAMG